MHKKAVPDAGLKPLNSMVKLPYTNRDSAVWSAGDLSYGWKNTTLSIAASIGSNYG
jgi:hypothetical protein